MFMGKNSNHNYHFYFVFRGGIHGVIQIESYWAILSDAEKPNDEHIKSGKYIKEKIVQRVLWKRLLKSTIMR